MVRPAPGQSSPGASGSTVSGEVRRHGGRRVYRAAVADTRAWARTRRPKVCRFPTRPAFRDAVAAKLAVEWAPQQIAGWLRHAYPDDPEMDVSHETIYPSLFVQSRGVLNSSMLRCRLRATTSARDGRVCPSAHGDAVLF